MKKIGLLGAGVMGRTVAAKFIEAGYGLTVYDAYGPAAEKIAQSGAAIAASPAEVAVASEAVIMFLPGPREVAACVAEADGLLSAAETGMVIVDMSTVDPASTRRMAALAAEKGIGYLDAPVLGRPDTVGKWALPVGGEAADLDRCREFLQHVAAHVIHIGDSGNGNKVKLLNQLMFGAINAMTAEMMAIARSVGIAPQTLYETITASQAGTVSNLFKELGRRISEEDYADPTFTVDLLIKDVALAVEMAKSHQAPPLLARSVEALNEIARAQGYGNRDTSIMWKSYQGIWGGGEPQ